MGNHIRAFHWDWDESRTQPLSPRWAKKLKKCKWFQHQVLPTQPSTSGSATDQHLLNFILSMPQIADGWHTFCSWVTTLHGFTMCENVTKLYGYFQIYTAYSVQPIFDNMWCLFFLAYNDFVQKLVNRSLWQFYHICTSGQGRIP